MMRTHRGQTISKSITDLQTIVTFTIAVPDDWTDQDLLELIFLPPRDPGKQNWPAWEIPAYDFVSFRLFRFWKGEKKPDK